MEKQPQKHLDIINPQLSQRVGGSGNHTFGFAPLAPATSPGQPGQGATWSSGRGDHAWARPLTAAAGVVMCAVGVVSFIIALHSNHLVADQVQTLQKAIQTKSQTPENPATSNNPDAQGDSLVPTTTRLSLGSIYSYQVQGVRPKRIEIKGLGVLARVVNLGINSKGHIDVPISIYDAGWYDSSSYTQAAVGSTIIVGHVGSTGLPGIFAHLGTLHAGDEVVVTNGDDTTARYRVTGNEQLPAATMDMGKYLNYAGSSQAKLYLITCTGNYTAKTFSYDDRMVVTAVKEQ